MGQRTGGEAGSNMHCGALLKSISVGIGAAVAVVILAGAAMAAPPTSIEGFTGTAPSQVQPQVTASPFTSVNLRGGATASLVLGACTGLTCNATGGHCACTTFNGTFTGTGYGKVTAAMKITEDDDDTTPDGAGGLCFPAMGTATLTTPGTRPSVAVLRLAGALRQFEVGTAFTVNGNFAYSQEAATGGTNKFATSFGTGNLSAVESVDQGVSGTLPSAVSVVGTLQLKH
jgi:hypothetical protein